MQRQFIQIKNIPSVINDIINAILIALLFSAFIYFEHWDISLKIVNSAFALLSLYALLTFKRRIVFFSGFFIGLLWFYWVGYSFEYYDFKWMVPIVSLLFAAGYMLIFGTLALTEQVWLRALILLAISFFEPLDFNWMQIELIFIESYFGVEKWQFILLIASLSLYATLKPPMRYISVLPLMLAIQFTVPQKSPPPIAVKLVSTQMPQELKWRSSMRSHTIENNLASIRQAIDENYDLVILPESVFPLFLNYHPAIEEELRKLSQKIAIITGALYEENGNNYNVSYFFYKGKMQIAKKMILVPFGEYIPLPKFIRSWVNDVFFGGSSDYVAAKHPTDFNIDGVLFRSAVCYEATREELYKDDPKFVAAMSNNAWFQPSIEPTLQKLLMRYYARRHNTTIYHSANMGGSGVVY